MRLGMDEEKINSERHCGQENHYFVYPKNMAASHSPTIFCRYCGEVRQVNAHFAKK